MVAGSCNSDPGQTLRLCLFMSMVVMVGGGVGEGREMVQHRPLGSGSRQLLIHLSAELRSAGCRLFVYNQHHQQLVWNQSAVTRCSEHHEHSLPHVCTSSLGVVAARLAQHKSSYLFKVTIVQGTQHFPFSLALL